MDWRDFPFALPSPGQPSSCHPGIISLLGLWIANTGYRKTNHQAWALHLVTPGSLVCDRCNKSSRHSPWHATWSSWHHDWSQHLKIYTRTWMLQQWLSHKLIEYRSPLWSLLCETLSERNVPGNDLKLYPRRPRLSSAWLTEQPAPTKNKIMKADRFVCFPKTLLASRITVFLPQPKYLRESGLRAGLTGPQQINSEWISWLINSRFIRACSLGAHFVSGRRGVAWLLQVTALLLCLHKSSFCNVFIASRGESQPLEPPRPASDSKNSLEVAAEPGSIDTTHTQREYYEY